MNKVDLLNEKRKELIKRIDVAEKYREEVIDKVQKLAARFSIGEISFFEYHSHLKGEFGDKTPEEWTRYYDRYILKCKDELEKCGDKVRKIRTREIAKKAVPLALFLVFTFSIYYYGILFGEKPVLFSPIESYSDNVNFSFNESGNFVWKVGNAGELNSLKISGEIVGGENVKVYLQDGGKEFLVLDSNDLEVQGGNGLTGNAIKDLNISKGENVSIEGLDDLNNSPKQPVGAGLNNNSDAGNATGQTGKDNKINSTINNTNVIISVKRFSEYCKETCDLSAYKLNAESYNFRVEIVGNSQIKIEKIIYELVQKENATVTGGNLSGAGETVSGNNTQNGTSNIVNLVKTEKRIGEGKEVKIGKKQGLKNIEVKSEIPLSWGIKDSGSIRVFWKEGNQDVVFVGNDLNGDGYIDEINWNVADLGSEQTYIIIVITKAEHLDLNRSFISDIYDSVRELDGIWSETINDGEYVRVTFEKNLTNENDITLWPGNFSGNPRIEVYEKDGNVKIAEFISLNENNYNKVYLNGLGEGVNQDTFDLKVIGGSLELDYVVDPQTSGFSDGGSVIINQNVGAPSTVATLATTFPAGDNLLIGAVQITSSDTGNEYIPAGGLILKRNAGGAVASNEYLIPVSINNYNNNYLFAALDSGAGANQRYDLTAYSSASVVRAEAKLTAISGVTYKVAIDTGSVALTAGSDTTVGSVATSFTAGANAIIASVQIDSNAAQNIAAGNIKLKDGDGTVLASNEFAISFSVAGPTDIYNIPLLYYDTAGKASETYTVTVNSPGVANAETKIIVFRPEGAEFSDGGSVALPSATETSVTSITTAFPANSELLMVASIQTDDTDNSVETMAAGSGLRLEEDGVLMSANQNLFAAMAASGAAGDGARHTLIYRKTPSAANSVWALTGNANAAGLNAEGKMLILQLSDKMAPSIDIIYPLNGSWFSNATQTINYTVSDNNLESCWYTNSSGKVNNTIICGNNLTNYEWLEGINNITIYANDSAGNANFSSVTFFVDTINPLINLTYPLNAIYGEVTSLNYTVFDTNLRACWYSLNLGVDNITIACGTNATGLTSNEGSNTWRVYANDSAGNVNFSSVTFTVSPSPKIPYTKLNSPLDASVFWTNIFNITLNVTVLDNTVGDSMNVWIYGVNSLNTGDFYKHGLLYQQFNVSNGSQVTYNWTSPVVVPDASTVALYHLDNNSIYGDTQTTAKDTSNYANVNLTAVGNVYPNMTGGKFAGGWVFDGNGDYLSDASDIGALNGMDNMTFSAWIKRAGNSANGYETIIREGGTQGFYGYALVANCNNNQIQFAVRRDISTIISVNASNSLIADGNWHHLAGTYDNSSGIYLYVDGVLKNSSDANIDVFDGSAGIRIGGSANSPAICGPAIAAASFNGTIDEVGIWNRSLSASEIMDLYRLNVGKYYWKVNVSDEAGNNNESEIREFNITLSNQAPVVDSVNFVNVGAILGGMQNVSVNFSATDLNGLGDLNDSSARVEIYNISKGVNPGMRVNSTCSVAGSSGNTKNYTCTIGMWYFDTAGEYIVNATVSDNGGLNAENSSKLFNYLSTQGFTPYPGAISWGILNPEDVNKTSIENLTINNTGNVRFNSVNITAYNLSGVTDQYYYIPAENFFASVNPSQCSSPASQLGDGTNTSISSFSLLAPGNLSINDGTGQEEIFFCLAQVPSVLPMQIYSTKDNYWWQIDLFAASFVVGGGGLLNGRKKRKKIVLEKEDLLELFGDKLEELLELVRANKIKKQLEVSEEEKITIPLGIFRGEIGAAEVLCKYLKENKGMRFAEIARTLNRDRRTIGLNYKNSNRMKKKIEIKARDYFVPVNVFADRRLSILESAVHYLRVEGYKNVEISKILGKDQRNVWTLHSRAVKKLKVKNENI